MSKSNRRTAFDELDSLVRIFRHAVHSQVCECKACRELLRGIVVCEDLFTKEEEGVK
jgi:hypothetical protein